MANAQHMFVVTGGPGSGKSSLIDAMTRRGFRTMPEAGRAIIQDQVGSGHLCRTHVGLGAAFLSRGSCE
jgi:predicted ATPase